LFIFLQCNEVCLSSRLVIVCYPIIIYFVYLNVIVKVLSYIVLCFNELTLFCFLHMEAVSQMQSKLVKPGTFVWWTDCHNVYGHDSLNKIFGAGKKKRMRRCLRNRRSFVCILRVENSIRFNQPTTSVVFIYAHVQQ